MSTIQAAIRKFEATGTTKTAAMTGAPKKIRPAAHRILVREIKKNPKFTARKLQAILEDAGACVTQETVQKLLNKDGINRRCPRCRPMSKVGHKI